MSLAPAKSDGLLDGNQATWSIPLARSKNGRAHVVPLSLMTDDRERADRHCRQACEELEKRDGNVTAARFLLVSPARDDQPIDGHALSVAMARFGKAFDLKCKDHAQKLEVEHGKGAASWFEDRPTAHDLRRTLATRLAALGIAAEDVKARLNYARGDATGRHYDQYDRLREKRRALELWSELLPSIIGGAPISNFVSLRGWPPRSDQPAPPRTRVTTGLTLKVEALRRARQPFWKIARETARRWPASQRLI
jgi:integrase